jgi:AhpD family alkylhydroperoxidase
MPLLDAIAPDLDGHDDDRLALAALAFGAAAAGDRPSSEVARLATVACVGPLPAEPWILVNLASAALAIADHLPAALELLDRGGASVRRQLRLLLPVRTALLHRPVRRAPAGGGGRLLIPPSPSRDAGHSIGRSRRVGAIRQRGEAADEARRSPWTPVYINSAGKVVSDSTLPGPVQELVKIRASQINGCGFCMDMHTKGAAHAGETQTRLNLIAAWREATVFTDAERAALELTEQGTRIADAAGGVCDEAWADAAKHFDEEQLASLVSLIALINAYNRMNVIVRQPAGDYQPGQFG